MCSDRDSTHRTRTHSKVFTFTFSRGLEEGGPPVSDSEANTHVISTLCIDASMKQVA